MPRSRDRHGRGIRGPLALPSPYAQGPMPLQRPDRQSFFTECVESALSEISRINPAALKGTTVGVEEVPMLRTNWSGNRVPLSAALEARSGFPAKIVVYERPLEHRAASRSQLRRLVHRTIVEQLSSLTGIAISELVNPDSDDWDF